MSIVNSTELAKHASSNDCWFVINGMVYDVTNFAKNHPGGEELIHDFAGKDATDAFEAIGHSKGALTLLAKYNTGKRYVE